MSIISRLITRLESRGYEVSVCAYDRGTLVLMTPSGHTIELMVRGEYVEIGFTGRSTDEEVGIVTGLIG